MATVLLCDNDITESQQLTDYLINHGYDVLHVSTIDGFFAISPWLNLKPIERARLMKELHKSEEQLMPEADNVTAAIVSEHFGSGVTTEYDQFQVFWTLDSFKPEIRLGYVFSTRPRPYTDFCFQIDSLTSPSHPEWLAQQVQIEETEDLRRLRNFGTHFDVPPIEGPYTPLYISKES